MGIAKKGFRVLLVIENAIETAISKESENR